ELYPELEALHHPGEGELIDDHQHHVIRGEVPRAVAADRLAARFRHLAPVQEKDHGLEDQPEQPFHARSAVLDVLEQAASKERRVELEVALHGRAALKTLSITSSIGGSSTVRSATSSSLKSALVTRGASSFVTRSAIRPPSRLTTSP